MLGHEAIDLYLHFLKDGSDNGKIVCFRNAIIGQASAFSLASLDLQRSTLVRRARDNMVNRLNLTDIPRPNSHRILVLLKTAGFTGVSNVSDLCSSVKLALSSIQRERGGGGGGVVGDIVEMTCSVPSEQSVHDQVSASRRASVVVAEHGTVSYGALYTHDGAVLISIGSREILKEPQILLYTAIFQTFYMVHEEMTDLDRYLAMAMDTTAANFRIGEVLYIASFDVIVTSIIIIIMHVYTEHIYNVY